MSESLDPATTEEAIAYTNRTGKTYPIPYTYSRGDAYPLDKYSIFSNYEDARHYANVESEDDDYFGLAYEGQVITVKTKNGQELYVIDNTATDNLRKLPNDEHTHEIGEVNDLTRRLNEITAAIAGGGGGGDASISYTVNGSFPDENGNFTITTDSINAAETVHTHQMSDVVNLTTTLDTKSDVNHTHAMVTSINVNNEELSGNVQLIGERNVEITQEIKNDSQSQITVGITPYTSDTTESIIDSNLQNTSYKFFVGTKSEWDDFKATISNNENYIVFLRS